MPITALAQRDLTDPQQGPHALQELIESLHLVLTERWNCARQLHRASPLVSPSNHFDRLGVPAEAPQRQSCHELGEGLLLRRSTRAMLPDLLRGLALQPPQDLLLVCPGIVFRTESPDRLHAAEPHQLDLWRLSTQRLDTMALAQMVQTAMRTALPGLAYRLLPQARPHLAQGMRIEAGSGAQWTVVGHCGLLAARTLDLNGLGGSHGLALTLGLDRLLMLRKGLPDIALLRSPDPQVQAQMLDLTPFQPPAAPAWAASA